MRTNKHTHMHAQSLLTTMVGDMTEPEQLQVKVLSSADRWFGMTYQEDRAAVTEELRLLHAKGVYPPTLKL